MSSKRNCNLPTRESSDAVSEFAVTVENNLVVSSLVDVSSIVLSQSILIKKQTCFRTPSFDADSCHKSGGRVGREYLDIHRHGRA